MSHPNPLILALVPDLWFLTQVRTSAAAHGATVESVRRAAVLPARAAEVRPALVIIDLATPGEDWAAAISAVKALAEAPPVLAFGPHVDTAAHAAARAAGADRVLSNRRLTEALTDLLARLLNPDTTERGLTDTGLTEYGASGTLRHVRTVEKGEDLKGSDDNGAKRTTLQRDH